MTVTLNTRYAHNPSVLMSEEVTVTPKSRKTRQISTPRPVASGQEIVIRGDASVVELLMWV